MVTLHLDFQERLGAVKPLNGVNNGPVNYGSVVDVSDYYREARIPYARLHDVNWPHPYEIDIHTIFPDFDKDPARPESYCFQRTDEYIASIYAAGTKVVYRLGESIEHTKTKYFVRPPRDFDKWAEICVGIIRHLNEGWAGGHHYGIEHWEIWNEPDGPNPVCMWSDGTPEQYFRLYETAAKRIKAHNPKLQVGGYAATMVNDDFAAAFFTYCRDRGVPLDFFSWHTYSKDVDFLVGNARKAKAWVDQYGYGHAQIHMNEWNYAPIGDRIDGATTAEQTRHNFRESYGHKGMSYDAAVMLALLDEPVDIANFYDGASSSYWGLFDPFGVPHKCYLAFKAFGLLREGTRALAQASGDAGLYCGASVLDGGAGRVMLANPGDKPLAVRLDVASAAARGVSQAWLTDEEHDWSPFVPDATQLELPPYSMCLMEYAPAAE